MWSNYERNQKALYKADVDFKTAKSFTEKVKQKALGQVQVLTAG